MDNGEAIQYVHKDLRYKREYLELALSSEYSATLKMRCMAKYRDDDELVKIALSANGRNIEYASARIRDDMEMAKYAITHQKSYYPESTVCNLSRRLRDNLEKSMDFRCPALSIAGKGDIIYCYGMSGSYRIQTIPDSIIIYKKGRVNPWPHTRFKIISSPDAGHIWWASAVCPWLLWPRC